MFASGSHNRAPLVFWVTAAGAAIGAAHGAGYGIDAQGAAASIRGLGRGALNGAMIAGALAALEVFVFPDPVVAPLRRAPFLVHVAARTAVYLAVILICLWFGRWLFDTGAPVERADVLFSLAASFAFVFLLDVNRLLGQNVLLDFVTGRYYRPRIEERVFLFIDMEGSTGVAERLGPLAFHQLLGRFVADLTGPIVAAGGQIHAYVGDEVIATWPLGDGVRQAACVRACFGAFDRLRAEARGYERDFGVAPAFRAGLHCGPVVTGEMGTVKKEIVFLGDTVNTTARIQEMCRKTGDRILASADLVARLGLPDGIAGRSLGDLSLRGKGANLELYALERAGEAAPLPPTSPSARAK